MIFIETLQGTHYDLKNIGLKPLSFILDSPSYNHVTENIDGRSGHIDLGTTISGRTMTVSFLMQAADFHDYSLLRSEVFHLFDSRQPFYLINTEQKWKRWLVKVANSYTPERITPTDATFEITFISSDAYAESIPTSLTVKEWDIDVWEWGMNINWDDYSYTHTVNNFVIYNAGNVVIDPRFMDLKITINSFAAEYLEIKNTTTGDVWRYNQAANIEDTLIIDGIRTTYNGLSVFRDTNKKLITLAPGENNFEISGSTYFVIKFDFRFKFL